MSIKNLTNDTNKYHEDYVKHDVTIFTRNSLIIIVFNLNSYHGEFLTKMCLVV